jgi:hypothetical protein
VNLPRSGAGRGAGGGMVPGMADITDTAAFKAVAAQVTAELLTRGLDVLDVTVVNILAEKVKQVAEGADMLPKTALGYIKPEVVAGYIADFAAASYDGGSAICQVARFLLADGPRALGADGFADRCACVFL